MSGVTPRQPGYTPPPAFNPNATPPVDADAATSAADAAPPAGGGGPGQAVAEDASPLLARPAEELGALAALKGRANVLHAEVVEKVRELESFLFPDGVPEGNLIIPIKERIEKLASDPHQKNILMKRYQKIKDLLNEGIQLGKDVDKNKEIRKETDPIMKKLIWFLIFLVLAISVTALVTSILGIHPGEGMHAGEAYSSALTGAGKALLGVGVTLGVATIAGGAIAAVKIRNITKKHFEEIVQLEKDLSSLRNLLRAMENVDKLNKR